MIRLTHAAQAADPNGLLPADLKAHFPRYAGGTRDPFAPGVVIAHALPKPAAAPAGRAQTGWALTGINSVNGVASALIENSATGESVFLQPGDQWNGLRVVSIKSDRVLFRNALGHEDTLTFAPASRSTRRAPAGPGPPPPAARRHAVAAALPGPAAAGDAAAGRLGVTAGPAAAVGQRRRPRRTNLRRRPDGQRSRHRGASRRFSRATKNAL